LCGVFGSESDVDVLVEFEEGHTPNWDFFSLQKELAAIIRRTVDLNTPGCLSEFFREQALPEARALYARA
jgi:uncharacterized protein